MDLSLYKRDTRDLIVNLPVARSTGYSTITGNYVNLTNQGIELVLTAKPVTVGGFQWEVNYTFTKNDSKVTKVDNESGKIAIYDAYGINFYAEKGKPLGVFYGPAPDKTPDGRHIADPKTGYYAYTTKQERELGTSQRDFIMGFRNVFSYKGLRLAMSMDWKQGGQMYSYTKRISYFTGNARETTYNNRNPFIIPHSVVESKDAEGKKIYIENTTPVEFTKVTPFYNAQQNTAIQSEHVIDKTFIRLRDITLSYKLPSEWIKFLSSVTLSVYGKNVFLWTPSGNSYVDPETTTYGRGIRSEFGEFATNPSQRSYGARLTLTF